MPRKSKSQDLSALTTDPSLAPVLALKPASKKAMENRYEDPFEGVTGQKLVRLAALALMNDPGSLPLPPAPLQITAAPIGDSADVAVLDELTRTYRFLGENERYAMLTAYLDDVRSSNISETFGEPDIELSPRQKEDVFREIVARPRLEPHEFGLVGFKSDPRWLGKRLEWDAEDLAWEDLPQKAPVAWEWLSRCSNPQAIVRWLYETVAGCGTRKRVLWLSGESNSYKSAFLEVFGRLFGNGFVALDDTIFRKEDQFGVSEIINKYFCLVEECGEWVLSSNKLKTVTGSKMLRGNVKFKPAVTFESNARFCFTSQKPPDIDFSTAQNKKAALNRIAFGWVGESPNPYPNDREFREWQESIEKELRWVICAGKALCPSVYLRQDLTILTVPTHIWECGNLFEKAPNHSIAALDFQRFCVDNGLSPTNDVGKLKAYLTEQLGARFLRTRFGIIVKEIRFKT